MKAVVSGSHGFLGSHLTKRLERLGHTWVPIKRELLFKPDQLTLFFQKEKPDWIVHLATAGNYSEGDDRNTIISANIIGIYNMLNSSLELPYKAFINFSSSSVLLERETFYSASKASAERLCKAFSQEYDKPIMSIRPATVIGVGEQERHLIPQLIESCIEGKEIPFVASPTHDFIDVSDVVSAVLTIFGKPKNGGKVFEAGNGFSISNNEVLRVVEDSTGKRAKLRIVDSLRRYDNEDWKVNSTLLLALGWQPLLSLEESVRLMVKYYYAKRNTKKRSKQRMV